MNHHLIVVQLVSSIALLGCAGETSLPASDAQVPPGEGLTWRGDGQPPSTDSLPSSTPEATIHVAPTGDDLGGDGSLAKPFATPDRGRDEVRARRAKGVPGPFTVYLRGGTYRRSEPLRLTAADSGSAGAPVIYRSYPGETAIISGGEVIVPEYPWVQTPSGSLFTGIGAGRGLRSLFVNGARATRARTPNSPAYYQIVAKDTYTPKLSFWAPIAQAPDGLNAESGSAEVVALGAVASRFVLSSIDNPDALPDRRRVSVMGGLAGTYFDFQPKQRFYLENTLEALDSPGEWYYNKKNGTLYYYPRAGEMIGTATLVVPRTTELLKISRRNVTCTEADGTSRPCRDDDPDPLTQERGPRETPLDPLLAHDITIEGLVFEYADWTMDTAGFPLGAEMQTMPAAVFMRCRGCRFVGNTIRHVGGDAIDLYGADNLIALSTLEDLGQSGVVLGMHPGHDTKFEMAYKNTVTDNVVRDLGVVTENAIGIKLYETRGTVIAHNEISRAPYDGIFVGYGMPTTFVPDPALVGGNVIEKNNIHDVMQITDDGGGIYACGNMPDTVIRANKVHDLPLTAQLAPSVTDFVYGIMVDGSAKHYRVTGNSIYRAYKAGLFTQGEANDNTDNVFQHNIVVASAVYEFIPTYSGTSTFMNNIVLQEGTPRLLFPVGNSGKYERAQIGLSDKNVFYFPGLNPSVLTSWRWAEWRGTGLDAASVVADPLFASIGADDFKLSPSSPALPLGFQQHDLSDVGPRP